jgi:hypothetical protein
MKTKWVKETPTEEGWYWIKYRNKRNKTTVCPCLVTIFKGWEQLNRNLGIPQDKSCQKPDRP